MSKLKAILFDFGGCLDSDGMHSRTLFLNIFKEFGVMTTISRDEFQDAYSYADQKIVKESLALKLNLKDSNRLMVNLMGEKIEIKNPNIIADKITEIQVSFLKKNLSTLEKLSKNFRLGIISNFTGNLEIILKEYGLHPLFEHILDSYHVGFSKPDVRIFHEALKRFQLPAEECLFIGDNIERDVLPAKSLGMKTVLIHEPEKKRDHKDGPTAYVCEIFELLDLTQKI